MAVFARVRVRDAIIVGAGLSGLVCARRLAAAGLDVIVLEARDRVGGRLLAGRVGGFDVDLGGQWMSVGQPRLAALAAELGIATVPQRREGRPIIAEPEAGVLAQLGAALAQWRAMRRIERHARTAGAAWRDGESMAAEPAERTATAALDDACSLRSTALLAALDGRSLAALDGRSLAEWLAEAVPDPIARERIALHADLVLAADPAELSALFYLAILGVTGGFGPRDRTYPAAAASTASPAAQRS